MTSKLGPNGIRDDWLIDEIRLSLLDAMDNPCGGLFASEIQSILREKKIIVTTQKISLMIKYRGKNIKIHPVELDAECGEVNYLNLYYTDPPLDLNNGNFVINSNLEYYDPQREIPKRATGD